MEQGLPTKSPAGPVDGGKKVPLERTPVQVEKSVQSRTAVTLTHTPSGSPAGKLQTGKTGQPSTYGKDSVQLQSVQRVVKASSATPIIKKTKAKRSAEKSGSSTTSKGCSATGTGTNVRSTAGGAPAQVSMESRLEKLETMIETLCNTQSQKSRSMLPCSNQIDDPELDFMDWDYELDPHNKQNRFLCDDDDDASSVQATHPGYTARNMSSLGEQTGQATDREVAQEQLTKDVPAQHVTRQIEEDIGFASRFATQTDIGDPLPDKLNSSVNFLMTHALEENHIVETCDKYPQPENSQLVVPKVNPIIWDNLSGKVRALDLRLQKCLKPLVKGMTAMLRTANTSRGEAEELTDTQQDAIALIANASYELNTLRKSLIKPDINSRYTHLCKPSVKTTQWLFGDDLHKTVKEMDEQQKTVGAIRGRTFFRQQRYNPYQQGPRAGSQAVPFQHQRYANAGWLRTRSMQPRARGFLGNRALSAQAHSQAAAAGRPSGNPNQRTPRYRQRPHTHTALAPDRRPALNQQ